MSQLKLAIFFSFQFFFFWPGRLKFKQLSYTSELISLICLMLRTLQLLRVQNEQVMLFKFSLQKMKSNTWVIRVSYTFNRPLWFKEVNERSNRKSVCKWQCRKKAKKYNDSKHYVIYFNTLFYNTLNIKYFILIFNTLK